MATVIASQIFFWLLIAKLYLCWKDIEGLNH